MATHNTIPHTTHQTTSTTNGIYGMSLGNMDMLKSQILTMFALKSGNTNDGIFMAIWAIIMISCIDAFFRFIPVLAARIESLTREYFKHRMSQIPLVANITPLTNRLSGMASDEASIVLIRNYEDKNETSKSANVSNKDMILEYELVDAVIEFICSQDTTRHLRYTNKYYMNNTEPIKITQDITAKMEYCNIDPSTNKINSLTIRLSSTTLKISQMKEEINRILGAYRAEKSNRLGGQKYYFNEFHIPPMPDMDGGFRWDTAPKRITFNMTPFNTFKSINNIFGSHIAMIRDRINLFINNREWYQQRGIPHTLGILLHGRPGCGKTSLIKAIARDTNRHVFNISLRETTTQRQLINLFFDENIAITNAANEASIISIPLDQRIYVIEDIDCMSDVVLDRVLKKKLLTQEMGDELSDEPSDTTNTYEPMIGMPGSMNTPIDFLPGMQNLKEFSVINGSKFNNNSRGDIQWELETSSKEQNRDKNKGNKSNKNQKPDIKENKDEITLSFLLNLLDGVLETPNRILIITSNYPERLDKALIRPGRIDLNIHFDNADMEMILDMFQHFYNLTILDAKKLELDSKIDKIFTPAEVIAVLCNNYKNARDAVASLNNLAQSKIMFEK
jgi:hypothetical protein